MPAQSFKSPGPAIMLAALLLTVLAARTPARADDEAVDSPQMGTIRLFFEDPNKPGWLECDGRELKVKEYGPIFGLIGSKFGGDGKETFALAKMPVLENGMKYYIAVSGIFPMKK